MIAHLDSRNNTITLRLHIGLRIDKPNTDTGRNLGIGSRISEPSLVTLLLERNVYTGDDRGNGITQRHSFMFPHTIRDLGSTMMEALSKQT